MKLSVRNPSKTIGRKSHQRMCAQRTGHYHLARLKPLLCRPVDNNQRFAGLCPSPDAGDLAEVLLLAPTQGGKTSVPVQQWGFRSLACHSVDLNDFLIYKPISFSSQEWLYAQWVRCPSLLPSQGQRASSLRGGAPQVGEQAALHTRTAPVPPGS